MLIRTRAPLRISFGGGGTDVPPYCDERGGAVLSATINRYACATLVPDKDRFEIRSLDYDASIIYGIDDSFVYDGQLDLAKGVIDHFRKTNGFSNGVEIFLHNDAPPGSGLGSSSAITVALIGAIAEYQRLPLDCYQIAELAYQIERIEVGIKGGKQDQYAATFGGFSFIEFQNGSTVVNALRLRPEIICELEYSLVFAYVGGQRLSSQIIEKQVKNYRGGMEKSILAMDNLRELAYDMKKALLLGRLWEFGELLNAAWENKKQMANGITNPKIDEIYYEARCAGALGGKVNGAGGGGFMLFFCDPRRRFSVQKRLLELNSQVVNFSFVKEGVRTWEVP
ncbi:MAG: GHMP kinase [Firmicutes bacterium]|nr:GHMP kinase [Bacillota bacterium]